ncbi:hypothetical protein PT287_09855 [Lactobacillus sp. ESL0679]|uniref:hypothetical protein n=1 Tax=Lactobacillus sp. ESL0679 TaxID=2983209 RepID=UPI0023FA1BE7|nr:hypothetical protein [Lactobacillus sp. ESL0679]MDF7683802.1 hypothetical protein [Lactobacillus sp. ESL0679]
MVMIFILLASFVIGYLRLLGIFGLVVGIILLIATGISCWKDRKKRQERDKEDEEFYGSLSNSVDEDK